MTRHCRGTLTAVVCALILLAGCGGGGSSGGGSVPGDDMPVSEGSAYDAADVPQPVPLADNLLSNGGFEAGIGSWDLCGTAGLINDASDAGAGQRFLRLDNSALCDRFDQSILEESHGWAYSPINLAAVPEVLHISLLARSSTPIELFEDVFSIRLMASEDRMNFFNRREATFLNSVDNAIDSTWTRVKLSITRQQIEAQIGDLVPQWLIVEAVGPNDDYVLGIDDIRLTTRPELVQANLQPTSLAEEADRNRLIGFDLDSQHLVGMLGDGSALTRFTSISTDSAVSYPANGGSNTMLFADRRFDPAISSDPNVIPGAGSNILRVDLTNGNETLISEQPGTPGYFLFDGSPSNRESIDITVVSIAWDTVNNRGINGVCGQNRSLGAIGGGACFLQLMDANGTTTLTNIESSAAAFSPDGSRVAYIGSDNKQVFIGTLSGQSITAQVAYESRGNLGNHLVFSADGQRLLLSSASAASILIDGNTVFPSVLKELDLATGEIESLLLADHGELNSNFAYSASENFIYYSISLPASNSQIWWLERATGYTGPVITKFFSTGVARY